VAGDGFGRAYDLRIHHDEILWPLLRTWKLFDLEGLPPAADQARERLAAHLAKIDRLANRFEAKRAAAPLGSSTASTERSGGDAGTVTAGYRRWGTG
jgi:fatty acid desaturase